MNTLDTIRDTIKEYGFDPISDNDLDVHFSASVWDQKSIKAHHASFQIEQLLDRAGIDRNMTVAARNGYITYRWTLEPQNVTP